MDHLLALTGVAIVAFASTNIDDLVLLMGFFADKTVRPTHVVIGQFAGMATLIALSSIGSLLALVVPTAYIGFIGFLPIAIGLHRLLRASHDEIEDTAGRIKQASQIVTVMLVTISNGGDNLSLYIPLFSIHSLGEVGMFIGIFLVMTALWCGVGQWLVKDSLLSAPLQRWGNIALPYVMIALGAYILIKTDVPALLGL